MKKLLICTVLGITLFSLSGCPCIVNPICWILGSKEETDATPKICIGSLAYILSRSKSELYVFDINNSRVITKQNTGKNPTGIAFSSYGSQTYVSNYDDNNISVFQYSDFLTYNNIFNVASGPKPVNILHSSLLDELYVLNEGDSTLSVFDTSLADQAKEPVIKYTIPIISQDKKIIPRKMALNPKGDKLFVTSKDSVYLLKLGKDKKFAYSDTYTLAKFDEELDLKGIIVDLDDNVYIADAANDEIIIFHPDYMKYAVEISVRDSSNKTMYPLNLAFNGNILYVTNTEGNTVSAIDIKAQKLIRNIPLVRGLKSDAYNPTGIAITLDQYGQEWGYVTNTSGRNLSVINVNPSILDIDRNTSTHSSVMDQPPLDDIIIPCFMRSIENHY